MADEAAAGSGRKGPPASEELTKALARGIGTLSMAAAIYAVETDRRLDTDELKEQNVNYLSLTPRAAHDLAEPLGSALYRSPLNKKYGRAIVDNIDVIGSLAELTIITLHWPVLRRAPGVGALNESRADPGRDPGRAGAADVCEQWFSALSGAPVDGCRRRPGAQPWLISASPSSLRGTPATSTRAPDACSARRRTVTRCRPTCSTSPGPSTAR
jgi:hypothetical protein